MTHSVITWAGVGTEFHDTGDGLLRGALEQVQIATPDLPDVGSMRLYPKADGLYYSLDSEGVELPLGGGGVEMPLTEHLTFSPDNTWDIGTTGFRPKNLLMGGALTVGGYVTLWSRTGIGAAYNPSYMLHVSGAANVTGAFTAGSVKAGGNVEGGAFLTDSILVPSGQSFSLQVPSGTTRLSITSALAQFSINSHFQQQVSIGWQTPVSNVALNIVHNMSGSGIFQAIKLVPGFPSGATSADGLMVEMTMNGSGHNLGVVHGIVINTPNYASGVVGTQIGIEVHDQGKNAITTSVVGVKIAAQTGGGPSLWVGGPIELSNGVKIKPVSNASISIESSTQYAMFSSFSGSHVSGNAYWDGANWLRWDVSLGASVVISNNAGLTVYVAPAAANPIAWSKTLTFDVNGDLNIPGYMRASQGIEAAAHLRAGNGYLFIGSDQGSYFYRPNGATWNQLIGSSLHLNSGLVAILDGSTTLQTLSGNPYAMSSRVLRLTGACLDFPYAWHDKIVFVAVDYSTPANPGIGVDSTGALGIFNHTSWTWIRFRQNNYIGMAAHQWNVNTGEAVHGPNGGPVGSNCLMSVHANYYGGIYYSTTSQFIAWPSQGAYKLGVEKVPNALVALANPSLNAVRYQRIAHRFTWYEPPPISERPTPTTPVPYRYPDVDPGEPVEGDITYGFRVEDWQEAFPELCVEGPGHVTGFNVVGVIPLAWQALREMYAEHLALREEVTDLRERLSALEAKVA